MRDRLVELVEQARGRCNGTSCLECKYINEIPPRCHASFVADHLLENGVIVPPHEGCKVCERITDANKDIFWTFARTHQPEDKDEFRRVPARYCPACGRDLRKEKINEGENG